MGIGSGRAARGATRRNGSSARPAERKGVARSAIIGRVFGEQAPNVVILQAPAGHGKSTTLDQLRGACEARQLLCGRLDLDETDNDSRRHAERLREMLARLAGRPSPTRPAGTPSPSYRRPAQRADWLIDALARLDRRIALFVDEFEVLAEAAVLSFWKDFLIRCPAHIRVFIASRSVPEIGLARLLVGNRALLLSADDLRFSREEVRTFFSAAEDVSLHDAEVDTIYSRSEGWPAAVQLFRLGLAHPGTRRSLQDLDHCRPRELAEYLTDCVLDGQAQDVRRFLLRTSLLTRLCAPLCDLLDDRDDSQKLLLRLERAGLFVRALDPAANWFGYHSLFASLLSEQLAESDPGAVIDIHRRAAAWLHEHGQHEDALHHATAASDFAHAAQILEQWSSRLVANGEMATIGRWFDRLPLGLVIRDSPLAVRMAWALIFLRRRARLAQLLQALDTGRTDAAQDEQADPRVVLAVAAMCADQIPRAFEIIDSVPASDEPLEGFAAFERAAAANLRAYQQLFTGDFVRAQSWLMQAKSFNQMGDASFSGGYTACFEGAWLLLQGRADEARVCLREGLEAQRRVLDSTFVSAALASCYLWALYELNDLDMLEAVAEEYRDMLAEAAVPDFFAAGQICIARVQALRGAADEAGRTLDRAQFTATRNGWPRIVGLLEWEQARLAAASGRVAQAAERIAVASGAATANGDAGGQAGPAAQLVASSRALLAFALARGDAVRSAAFLEQHAVPADAGVYSQLRLLVAQALLAADAGTRGSAQRYMRKALDLAMKGGLVRPLLDQSPAVMPLIRQIVDSGQAEKGLPLNEFARRLAPRGASRGGASLPAPVLRFDSFTPREREIMGYLSIRLSNKEIAGRALLSLNTVKFHLKSIFTKLGVSSRLEAYAAIVRLNVGPGA